VVTVTHTHVPRVLPAGTVRAPPASPREEEVVPRSSHSQVISSKSTPNRGSVGAGGLKVWCAWPLPVPRPCLLPHGEGSTQDSVGRGTQHPMGAPCSLRSPPAFAFLPAGCPLQPPLPARSLKPHGDGSGRSSLASRLRGTGAVREGLILPQLTPQPHLR